MIFNLKQKTIRFIIHHQLFLFLQTVFGVVLRQIQTAFISSFKSASWAKFNFFMGCNSIIDYFFFFKLVVMKCLRSNNQKWVTSLNHSFRETFCQASRSVTVNKSVKRLDGAECVMLNYLTIIRWISIYLSI